ncbi:MAG: YhfC family glutamic-type intramembrane protease [Chloroflexota bacterium]|jgi:uncharacterized membrane protein YhfC|nr:YhfC family glutamic-type intramembrane protease [Chloroflexota bacterium]
MVLLAIAIVIALLITIGLPFAGGFLLNRRSGVTWRVILYGALGYFITQALLTLVFSGFTALVDNGILALSDQAFLIWQLVLSVFLAAVIGVLIRWLAMEYIKEDLNTLEGAYGIGVGYGGVESAILVGLPLLTTFVSMVSNMNIDPQSTTLDPAVAAQIEQLWQVNPLIPLAGSLERISAFIMHITVTVLILQNLKRDNLIWLAAAVGLEVLVNGLIVGLSEAGMNYGWIILVSVFIMAGNIYLLYRLDAFNLEGFGKQKELDVD